MLGSGFALLAIIHGTHLRAKMAVLIYSHSGLINKNFEEFPYTFNQYSMVLYDTSESTKYLANFCFFVSVYQLRELLSSGGLVEQLSLT